MNRFTCYFRIGFLVSVLPFASFAALTPKPTLVGKFIATNVQGSVSYTSGDRILDLKKGDTIPAGGTVIETSAHAKVTLVFSNRASVVLDENTRLRVEKFDQEFFVRSDDPKSEPSKSVTAIDLLSGRVVVNAPALHQGTSMVYRTSQADVAVLAEKVVISTNDQQTMVAVVSGAAAVRNTQVRSTSFDTGVRLVSGQSIQVATRVNSASPAPARDAFLSASDSATPASSPRLSAAARALAAAVRTAVLADPAAAAAIARKATASAPDHAAVIAYAAVKAAPEQAAQISFAIIQALSGSGGSNRTPRVRTASAVAAAAAAAAPERAAFITASAIQGLLQSPGPALSADERIEFASTIAAAVAATTPAAAEITSAALTALTLVTPNAPGAGSQLAVSAARVVAAVARVAPAESETIGVAAVRWVMQNAPGLSDRELADSAGLIAAVAAQASPERATAINNAIAGATNISVMTLQASAARSTAVASQVGQQLGGLLQNAAAAVQLAGSFEPEFRNGSGPDRVVGDAVFRRDSTEVAAIPAALSDEPPASDSLASPQLGVFDPASLGSLAGDVAAAESAQEDLVFDTGTAPDGTPVINPLPTVPATLPVEFVTSPASGTG